MATVAPTKVLSAEGILSPNGEIQTHNLVGPRIRRFRSQKNWSQKKLAEQLQRIGLDKSREGIARIESQIVHVCDFEMLYFAKALGIERNDLYPDIDPLNDLHETVTELMKPRKSTFPKRPKRRTKQRGKSFRR